MRAILTHTMLVSLPLAALAACSGADPNGLNIPNHAVGSPSASTSPAAATDDGGAPPAATSPSGTDAGVSGPTGTDAAAPPTGPADASPPAVDAAPPPPPPNAFTGTPPFQAGAASTDAQSHHDFSLAGRNCFDCHGGASPSSGIRFSFAGRVFADAAGQTPASGIEVRVVDANGAGKSTYSDGSGYFWSRSSTALALPALAGARSATSTSLMVEKIVDATKSGGCNACHDASTTAYVHVP